MGTYLVSTLTERYVTGSWSSISAYVVSDIEGEYMIASNEPTDLLAAIGEVSFTVNNGNGIFSPNSAFQRGTPIRITTTYDGTPKVKFLGTILDLVPDTQEWGDQYVHVTAVDWMNFAVNYPMIIPAIQSDLSADEAVQYLLSLIQKQPDSVTYYEGREGFDYVFDTIKEQTRLYSELNKIALSEFAPIYMRAGNNLVVESANTRRGTRELTQIPVKNSDLEAILLDPNGYAILLSDDGNFPILADELFTPNLASGTVRPLNVEIEHGKSLVNQVTVRAYPSSVSDTPQILFELQSPIPIPTLSSVQIKGTWANPDGGSLINASNIIPMVSGTNYQAFATPAGTGSERTGSLVVTENYGAEGFVNTVFNNTKAGWITKFTISGYGIYPYNPVDALIGVTGSISEYGNAYLQIDQKYQDEYVVGVRIAEIITDDEKTPRNQLVSTTFDASSSPELMQASQHMDIGDLTHVTNVKPAMDTYAYIQGKEFTITPAGVVTEKWYLKEMDSFRKGLSPIALKFAGVSASKNGVNFGTSKTFDNLPRKTLSMWIRNAGSPTTFPMFGKYDGENGFYLFQVGPGFLGYRQNFTPDDGLWESGNVMTGSAGVWHHIAVSHDNTSPANDPTIYLDGSSVAITEVDTPSGVVDVDENANLILGNLSYPSFDYFYNNGSGLIKNARIYNEILSPADILDLANPSNQDNYLNVPDGLVFQAFAVKTEDYAGYTGTVLYPQNKLIDGVYGIRGTPNWNLPSGTSNALRADS